MEAAKCGACGHIYATNAPPGAGVHAHEESSSSRFAERNRDLVRLLRGRGLEPGDRVLDIGAGHGHISRAVAESMPVTVHALEADQSSRAFLTHCERIAARIEDLEGGYDFAIMVEVIEHLEDPVGFMRELRGRLKPGAKILLTTPCGETRRGRRDTNAYDAAEHVQFFTERSLALALDKAGYDFRLETLNQMSSKLTKPPLRYLKDMLRPVRARLTGHVHLTGFAVARGS